MLIVRGSPGPPRRRRRSADGRDDLVRHAVRAAPLVVGRAACGGRLGVSTRPWAGRSRRGSTGPRTTTVKCIDTYSGVRLLVGNGQLVPLRVLLFLFLVFSEDYVEMLVKNCTKLRVGRKTFWGVFGKCFGPNLSV